MGVSVRMPGNWRSAFVPCASGSEPRSQFSGERLDQTKYLPIWPGHRIEGCSHVLVGRPADSQISIIQFQTAIYDPAFLDPGGASSIQSPDGGLPFQGHGSSPNSGEARGTGPLLSAARSDRFIPGRTIAPESAPTRHHPTHPPMQSRSREARLVEPEQRPRQLLQLLIVLLFLVRASS